MKKFNQKGFGVIEGLILLIFITALIGAGIYVKNKNDKAKRITPVELVASIKNDVKEKYPQVKLASEDDGAYNGSVSSKAEPYEFFSSVETKNHFNFILKDRQDANATGDEEIKAAEQQDKDSIRPVSDLITSSVEKAGFEKIADYPVKEFLGENGAAFQRGDDVCVVNAEYSAGIACATISDLAKVANEVKPFVKIFEKSYKDNKDMTPSYGSLSYGTGTTAKDTYATMSIGWAAAYFYQENDSWKFFTITQEGIDCASTTTNQAAERAFSKTCRKPGEGL